MPYSEVLRRFHEQGPGWGLTCWCSPLLIDGKEVASLEEQIALMPTLRKGERPVPVPGAKYYAVIAKSTIHVSQETPAPTRDLFDEQHEQSSVPLPSPYRADRPSCMGCGSTEGQIIPRVLVSGTWGLSCDDCAAG